MLATRCRFFVFEVTFLIAIAAVLRQIDSSANQQSQQDIFFAFSQRLVELTADLVLSGQGLASGECVIILRPTSLLRFTFFLESTLKVSDARWPRSLRSSVKSSRRSVCSTLDRIKHFSSRDFSSRTRLLFE